MMLIIIIYLLMGWCILFKLENIGAMECYFTQVDFKDEVEKRSVKILAYIFIALLWPLIVIATVICK